MKKIFYIILVCAFFLSCKTSKQTNENREIITNDFPLTKFQNIIFEFNKSGYLNMNNEICCEKDLLNTKNKVIDFSNKLIRDEFLFIKKRAKITFKINEDESSKIWFVIANVENTFAYSDEIQLIIIKNNSKVLYFNKVK